MDPRALNTDERTKVEAGPGGICRAREDTLVKVRKTVKKLEMLPL